MSDGYTLIRDVTLVAPASSQNFSGLDGDEDQRYLIRIFAVMASTCHPMLRINDDTGNNYDNLAIDITGVGLAATEVLATDEFTLASAQSVTEQSFIDVNINARSGDASGRVISAFASTNGSGAGDIHIYTGRWSNSADKLVSLEVFSGNALPSGTFGPGSRFQLYKSG